MSRQYRQGDILLCEVDQIPPTATAAPSEGHRVILALGELTGHAHAFAAGASMLREAASGRSFLVIDQGGAILQHEEHDPLQVPEGRYELKRQREYTPKQPGEYMPRRPRYVAD